MKKSLLALSILLSTSVMADYKIFANNGTKIFDFNTKNLSTSEDCYKSENIGTIGTEYGCNGMLIVDKTMLEQAVSDGSYDILYNGNQYTFKDDEHNVFTGQIKDMSNLFKSSNFNQDIGYWDTSNVTNMYSMFRLNSSFNIDISNWDVSNVINMFGTFQSASNFNQDISIWDVSSVERMDAMFRDATKFNQDISIWNTSNVIEMGHMFREANSFNQDLSDWCVDNVTLYNGSEPYYFDYLANNWSKPRPNWGTCPGQ